MPELPEVETIRRQLAPRIEGRALQTVEILDPRWTRPGPLEAVQAGLIGRRVEESLATASINEPASIPPPPSEGYASSRTSLVAAGAPLHAGPP